MNKFYAVRKGHNPGIYKTWNECSEQVKGFPNASFKKFETLEDAKSFMIPDDIGKALGKSEIKEIKEKKSLFTYYRNFRNLLSPKFKEEEWYKYFFIFTDGSKTHDKSGYAVFINIKSEHNTYKKVDATNNYCELNAILTSLNIIKKMYDDPSSYGRMYIIVSDSEYGIKSITTHMDNWIKEKRTDYKNKETLDAINNMLVMLDSINIPIGFLHVRSHTRKPTDTSTFEYNLWFGNACVDTLARDGIVNVSTLNVK